MNFTTTIASNDSWFFRSTAHFNQICVNGLSGTDGVIFLNGVNLAGLLSSSSVTLSSLQGLSGNWEATYALVQANSALWEESTDIAYLSSVIDTNALNITSISSNLGDVFTTVQTNSSTTWLADSAVDLLVHTSSGNWNEAFATTNTLSSIWQTAVQPNTDVTFNNLTVSSLVLMESGVSISTHVGATSLKRIILMDEDGDSTMYCLRGGIITYD